MSNSAEIIAKELSLAVLDPERYLDILRKRKEEFLILGLKSCWVLDLSSRSDMHTLSVEDSLKVCLKINKNFARTSQFLWLEFVWNRSFLDETIRSSFSVILQYWFDLIKSFPENCAHVESDLQHFKLIIETCFRYLYTAPSTNSEQSMITMHNTLIHLPGIRAGRVHLVSEILIECISACIQCYHSLFEIRSGNMSTGGVSDEHMLSMDIAADETVPSAHAIVLLLCSWYREYVIQEKLDGVATYSMIPLVSILIDIPSFILSSFDVMKAYQDSCVYALTERHFDESYELLLKLLIKFVDKCINIGASSDIINGWFLVIRLLYRCMDSQSRLNFESMLSADVQSALFSVGLLSQLLHYFETLYCKALSSGSTCGIADEITINDTRLMLVMERVLFEYSTKQKGSSPNSNISVGFTESAFNVFFSISGITEVAEYSGIDLPWILTNQGNNQGGANEDMILHLRICRLLVMSVLYGSSRKLNTIGENVKETFNSSLFEYIAEVLHEDKTESMFTWLLCVRAKCLLRVCVFMSVLPHIVQLLLVEMVSELSIYNSLGSDMWSNCFVMVLQSQISCFGSLQYVDPWNRAQSKSFAVAYAVPECGNHILVEIFMSIFTIVSYCRNHALSLSFDVVEKCLKAMLNNFDEFQLVVDQDRAVTEQGVCYIPCILKHSHSVSVPLSAVNFDFRKCDITLLPNIFSDNFSFSLLDMVNTCIIPDNPVVERYCAILCGFTVLSAVSSRCLREFSAVDGYRGSLKISLTNDVLLRIEGYLKFLFSLPLVESNTSVSIIIDIVSEIAKLCALQESSYQTIIKTVTKYFSTSNIRILSLAVIFCSEIFRNCLINMRENINISFPIMESVIEKMVYLFSLDSSINSIHNLVVKKVLYERVGCALMELYGTLEYGCAPALNSLKQYITSTLLVYFKPVSSSAVMFVPKKVMADSAFVCDHVPVELKINADKLELVPLVEDIRGLVNNLTLIDSHVISTMEFLNGAMACLSSLVSGDCNALYELDKVDIVRGTFQVSNFVVVQALISYIFSGFQMVDYQNPTSIATELIIERRRSSIGNKFGQLSFISHMALSVNVILTLLDWLNLVDRKVQLVLNICSDEEDNTIIYCRNVREEIPKGYLILTAALDWIYEICSNFSVLSLRSGSYGYNQTKYVPEVVYLADLLRLVELHMQLNENLWGSSSVSGAEKHWNMSLYWNRLHCDYFFSKFPMASWWSNMYTTNWNESHLKHYKMYFNFLLTLSKNALGDTSAKTEPTVAPTTVLGSLLVFSTELRKYVELLFAKLDSSKMNSIVLEMMELAQGLQSLYASCISYEYHSLWLKATELRLSSGANVTELDFLSNDNSKNKCSLSDTITKLSSAIFENSLYSACIERFDVSVENYFDRSTCASIGFDPQSSVRPNRREILDSDSVKMKEMMNGTVNSMLLSLRIELLQTIATLLQFCDFKGLLNLKDLLLLRDLNAREVYKHLHNGIATSRYVTASFSINEVIDGLIKNCTRNSNKNTPGDLVHLELLMSYNQKFCETLVQILKEFSLKPGGLVNTVLCALLRARDSLEVVLLNIISFVMICIPFDFSPSLDINPDIMYDMNSNCDLNGQFTLLFQCRSPSDINSGMKEYSSFSPDVVRVCLVYLMRMVETTSKNIFQCDLKDGNLLVQKESETAVALPYNLVWLFAVVGAIFKNSGNRVVPILSNLVIDEPNKQSSWIRLNIANKSCVMNVSEETPHIIQENVLSLSALLCEGKEQSNSLLATVHYSFLKIIYTYIRKAIAECQILKKDLRIVFSHAQSFAVEGQGFNSSESIDSNDSDTDHSIDVSGKVKFVNGKGFNGQDSDYSPESEEESDEYMENEVSRQRRKQNSSNRAHARKTPVAPRLKPVLGRFSGKFPLVLLCMLGVSSPSMWSEVIAVIAANYNVVSALVNNSMNRKDNNIDGEDDDSSQDDIQARETSKATCFSRKFSERFLKSLERLAFLIEDLLAMWHRVKVNSSDSSDALVCNRIFFMISELSKDFLRLFRISGSKTGTGEFMFGKVLEWHCKDTQINKRAVRKSSKKEVYSTNASFSRNPVINEWLLNEQDSEDDEGRKRKRYYGRSRDNFLDLEDFITADEDL